MKKNNVFKVIALMLILVMGISVLTGCNKATDKDEQGRTVISVSNWPASEGTSMDIMTARKANFEAANPDVFVEPSTWTLDRKTFYAKAAGGQLPTLYLAGFTEVPEIINSELSADLTDVLKERGYDGMFNEAILKAVSDEKGNVKSFPNTCYLLGLAYNVDLFEKAGLMNADGTPKQPKDWNELVDFAKIIKEKTGKAGLVFPTANNVGGWIFSSVAWSFGVDFIEKDNDGKWQATFNTPEAAEALQWVKDLKWKHDVLPANTLVDMTEQFKTFGTGGAAMVIAAGDFPSRVVQYGMKPEHVGAMAIPAGPKAHVALLGGGSWNVAENATKDQIDAAVRWLEITRSFKLTEDFKKSTIDRMKVELESNQLVGIKGMSIWSKNSEALKWEHEQIDKMANANINHVKLYNDFVADCPVEIRAEEPVCCQELYAILDSCLQAVLADENADCAKILENANADFQTNYLNNLAY